MWPANQLAGSAIRQTTVRSCSSMLVDPGYCRHSRGGLPLYAVFLDQLVHRAALDRGLRPQSGKRCLEPRRATDDEPAGLRGRGARDRRARPARPPPILRPVTKDAATDPTLNRLQFRREAGHAIISPGPTCWGHQIKVLGEQELSHQSTYTEIETGDCKCWRLS